MNRIVKALVPKYFWFYLDIIYYKYSKRPCNPAETAKAFKRRLKEGFFDKYCQGKGLDIGYGGDLLVQNCKGWDIEDGDAQYLNSIDDEVFDFVYSSHTLEHMKNIPVTIKNWCRVLKKGGYLILYIPHRDLYEKKVTLPSRWNKDHKWFFLLYKNEPPYTIGIVPLIQNIMGNCEIIYAKECSEGHTILNPESHSDGEYSIELVVKK